MDYCSPKSPSFLHHCKRETHVHLQTTGGSGRHIFYDISKVSEKPLLAGCFFFSGADDNTENRGKILMIIPVLKKSIPPKPTSKASRIPFFQSQIMNLGIVKQQN